MPSAAILAGGHATRFGGRDKSALVVGGRSILLRQIEELSQIADDILIVGRSHPIHEGPDGTPEAALPARLNGATLRHIPDITSSCGPLGGLDAALAAARHQQVVVVACDMPFVTARFLAFLLSLAGEAEAIVPRTEDGYHPLCAVYTRECRPAVARRLAEGKLSMRGLLEDVRVRVVEGATLDACGDRARLLANVNSPAALEAVLADPGRSRHEA